MADIKTRDAVKGTIKTLDKAAVASERMKSAYSKIKSKAEQGYYADENSATEYAADKVSAASERITDEGVHQFNKQGQKAVKTTKDNIVKAKDMLGGFSAGCDDYISKPFPIEVLRKKVLAILKRTLGEKNRIKYKNLEVDTDKCLVLMKGQEIHLTSTEYKLLLYLMENRGRVVTKAML